MEVNETPPPNEEIKKKKRRKKKQNEEGDSIVDDVTDGCFWDGCYVVSWLPWDIDGGCIPDFDGGCFDIGDGCSFDGCSMIFFPIRFIVILGLMAYGDWDYKAWKAKV